MSIRSSATQKIKIMSIAGARPNFIKLAALSRAIDSHNRRRAPGEGRIDHIIVHTGQHYDAKMSRQFFDELEIPRPDINLEAGSASHAVQIDAGKTPPPEKQVHLY